MIHTPLKQKGEMIYLKLFRKVINWSFWLHNSFRQLHALGYNTVISRKRFRAQPFLRHHLAVLWPASSSHLLLESLVTVGGQEEKMNLPNKITIDLFLSYLVFVQKEQKSWRICFECCQSHAHKFLALRL